METTCKFDHNGEYLICDCTLEYCAFDRWKNKDYSFESEEELDKMFLREKSLFKISILDTIYSLEQHKNETVDDFKIRLQKYFDSNDLQIIVE